MEIRLLSILAKWRNERLMWLSAAINMNITSTLMKQKSSTQRYQHSQFHLAIEYLKREKQQAQIYNKDDSLELNY